MARSMNKEELEATVSTGEQTVPTESQEADYREVQVSSNKKKSKIQLTEDVSCLIARKEYSFKKGRAYEVPADVAAIICNSQKAFRV